MARLQASSSLICSSSSSIHIPSARRLSSTSSSAFVSSSYSYSLPLTCFPHPKPLASKLLTTNCSLSEEYDQASSSSASIGRRTLASVVATGAALAVFTNMAIAAQGPGNEGPRRTAEKADQLLKAADKLNIEDAPKRFGPGSSGGMPDPTKISQTAGSGPLSSAQEGISEAAKNVQQKSGGFFGFGKTQSDAVADNAKRALSQAKGKTEEVATSVRRAVNRDGLGRFRGPAKDIASNVEEAVGQAQSKKGQLRNAVKDAIGQAEAKTDLGNSGGNVLGSLQEGIQGLKESVAQTGADAKNAVFDTFEKTLQ